MHTFLSLSLSLCYLYSWSEARDLGCQVSIPASEIQDPLSRAWTQQRCDQWGAQVRDEPCVLIIQLRIPLLRKYMRVPALIAHIQQRASTIRH